MFIEHMFDSLRAPARLPRLDQVLLSRSDCRGSDVGGDEAAARIRRACPTQLLSLSRALGAGHATFDGRRFRNSRGRPAVADARSPLDRSVAVTMGASVEPAAADFPGVFPSDSALVTVSVSTRDAVTRVFDMDGREDRDPWARALFAPAAERHLTALGVLHAVASYYVMAVAPDGHPLPIPAAALRRRR